MSNALRAHSSACADESNELHVRGMRCETEAQGRSRIGQLAAPFPAARI